uniref:MBL fold metallo-hydrolase n=1 Tax=Ignisphaera aggregans TaxID=334771 RepID=A0A7J3Z8E0_9CREN
MWCEVAMVKVVFLGVGGWISDPLLGYTSFAIVNSKRKWILVEAGEGLFRYMRICGLGLGEELAGVVVSHRHGDHILGIPTLLQMAKHTGLKKLRVVSIRDVLTAVLQLVEVSGSQNTLNILELVEVGLGERIRLEDFEIEFAEAVHTLPAVSMKIYSEGKCIVYSGDTAYNPKLIQFAKNCDMLIHEASGYSEEAHRYGHSTYQDAIEAAAKSNVKKLVLIHFYQWPSSVKTPIQEKLDILIPHPCQEIEL